MAKEQIKGKIGILFLIMLVNGLIISLASLIPVVGTIVGSFVLAPAFSIAIINIYWRARRIRIVFSRYKTKIVQLIISIQFDTINIGHKCF